MRATVLTNARLVFDDEIVAGSIHFDKNGILAVDSGPCALPAAEDVGGDYVMPGLIDMHTDEMERHFIPRPGVHWPDPRAAVLAYDGQIATAGVTTVYDCIRAGGYGDESHARSALLFEMLEAVTGVVEADLARAEHLIHLRCETSDPGLEKYLPPLADYALIKLVSIMDHTPGQRQFRNIDKLKQFASRLGKSDAEMDRDIARRLHDGTLAAAENRQKALAFWAGKPVMMASHDDTTLDHVRQAHDEGFCISEFPCTLEAAEEALRLGLATVAGAPNAVRGESHSGNVTAETLAANETLTALSSDYVPASLLQAPFRLSEKLGTPLTQELQRVTSGVADMMGLTDRGRLEAKQRADIIRVGTADGTPFVRSYWRQGHQFF